MAGEFYVLKSGFVERWPSMVPGDVIIAPNSMLHRIGDYKAWAWDETHHNHDKLNCVIVKHNPLLIVSAIPGRWLQPGDIDDKAVTYIVYSRTMGIIVRVDKR